MDYTTAIKQLFNTADGLLITAGAGMGVDSGLPDFRGDQGLWQHYPALRRAALAQGLLSVAFSAFWSTLAVMLAEHYHLGSATAGGFGIAGAAGLRFDLNDNFSLTLDANDLHAKKNFVAYQAGLLMRL